MNIFKGILIFIAGIISGAAMIIGFWYSQNSTTEVWVSQTSVQSDSGIIIPAGTELVLDSYMPEGFVSLNLGINVEGEALNIFTKTTEQRSFFRSPYFVHKPNE